MNNILIQKKQLRTSMKNKRAALDLELKEKLDKKICNQLHQIIINNNYKVIHAYIPMGDEIDILPLLKTLLATNHTIVTPKTLKKMQLKHLIVSSFDLLENGLFGTKHPANDFEYKETYDMIIVPGLAFDNQGYRLGYGGGYYDSFLKNQPSAHKIGIGYSFQKVTKVPIEDHDCPIDNIITF